MKALGIGTALFLVALIGPVIIRQLGDPGEHARHHYDYVRLDDTTYREVTFRNNEHDLDLAGLLFVPSHEDPFPAAVIIRGSGPSHRDSGWTLTLIKYLQANGIAVLLPDKRGSGKSSGDWRTASFEDLATDTLAAVRYLKDGAGLPITDIGLIGMSQGGHIAPLAAARTPDAVFVVNVVGAAVPMHDQLVFEETHNIEEFGVLPGLSNLLAYPAAWSIREIRQQTFWNAIGNFDPIPWWRKTEVPVLVLYGEEDANTPTEQSAALLRALDKPNLTVKIYEGSGHALESPMTVDNPSIFRRDALEDIHNFIMESTRQQVHSGSGSRIQMGM